MPLFVDFTASAWTAADGATTATQTYGGLSVTLTASGGLLNFNAADAPAPSAQTGPLALDGDGIGIGDDEIGQDESLSVSFSSGVTVLGLGLLDLYPGEGPGNAHSEQFAASFGAAGLVTGSASGLDPSGVYVLSGLGLGGIDSIDLSPLGGSWSDFALAGLWLDYGGVELLSSAVRVPEPGSLVLLGVALLFMSGVRSVVGMRSHGMSLARGRRNSVPAPRPRPSMAADARARDMPCEHMPLGVVVRS